MLAKRRAIKLAGQEVARTPLLVPSFSSKGFPEVAHIVDYMSEVIDGATLISAYDLHYKELEPPFNFPSLIFLDSGGYEASKDTDLSEFGEKEHRARPWTREMHEDVLKTWKPTVPSFLINYDHPKERLSLRDQVERAKSMCPAKKGFLREILLKPEKEGQRFLQIEPIVENVRLLKGFDAIGVTEKEVGNSILQRMQNIAKIRLALQKVKLDTPIHVFGSLDTVTTPMYFLAGADIFDGLTWLRFAFHNGQTIYKQNFGATEFGVSTKAHLLDGRCWNHNYYYMRELELEMQRFLRGNDFAAFKFHGDIFKKALESVLESTIENTPEAMRA